MVLQKWLPTKQFMQKSFLTKFSFGTSYPVVRIEGFAGKVRKIAGRRYELEV
jgi:hypothetical protein